MRLLSYSALLVALAAATGMTHMNDKNSITLSVSISKSKNPLESKYATLEITNKNDEPIEIWSKLPDGLGACLDVELINCDGNRISKQFYRRSISSPFEKARLSATLPSGKSVQFPIEDLFEGVDDGDLKPGKYKCRIIFAYENLAASSKEFEVEVAKADIEKRK
jgi:hypothetical protein